MATAELLRKERSDFRYLGYLLHLGSAEFTLLEYLVDHPDRGFDTVDLLLACGIARGNISTVVSAINRKAMRIGGRALILSGKSTGYRIVPFP